MDQLPDIITKVREGWKFTKLCAVWHAGKDSCLGGLNFVIKQGQITRRSMRTRGVSNW